MSAVPLRCVVDTNVPATANDPGTTAGPDCWRACVEAIEVVTKKGHFLCPAEIAAAYEKKMGG